MAVLDILQFGDDILREKSTEVADFNEELWELLDDMAETMYEAGGVGLAAPQVGVLSEWWSSTPTTTTACWSL